MSDENVNDATFPTDERTQPTVRALPSGTALSVLWWVEEEREDATDESKTGPDR